MAKRLGVFVDTGSLYYCVGKKFPGRKLDYQKYLAWFADLGEVQVAFAYGTQLKDEAGPFIRCLKTLGFNTRFKVADHKRIDWGSQLTIDVIAALDRLDTVIIGSSDSNISPLVSYLREKGIKVIVFACGIGRELRENATTHTEIFEALLEERGTKNETA